jgi:uncharacterized protein (UPF0332 family)
VTEDAEQLVSYRLKQARQTLEAGRDLLAGSHFRDAINRAYYAMFYAALGLLTARQLGSSKHAGVLSLFGRHFVNTGEFPPAKAVYLRQAFDLRQKYDYRELVEPDQDQAEEVLERAAEFLSEAEQTWERMRRTDQ